ncbi:hypothetical protein IPF86_02260 [Candidatus Nomurabacteria bacterium]|nr:MAG: hypothetical protein IPF86_02260 [Candidatus Nomurabacteria bacterium]
MTLMRRELGYTLLGFIAFIFLTNLIASVFYWYISMWWFDMPMHFLGGVWLALFGYWLLLVIFERKHLAISDIRSIPTIRLMLFVLILGISWEFFEFVVSHTTGAMLGNTVDSLSDICFDLAGGLVGLLYLKSVGTSIKENITPAESIQ